MTASVFELFKAGVEPPCEQAMNLDKAIEIICQTGLCIRYANKEA